MIRGTPWTEHLPVLGEHVKFWRKNVLKVSSRLEIGEISGLSGATWGMIENGQPVSHSSYRKIEHCLGWPHGWISLMLKGVGPPPVPGSSPGEKVERFLSHLRLGPVQ